MASASTLRPKPPPCSHSADSESRQTTQKHFLTLSLRPPALFGPATVLIPYNSVPSGGSAGVRAPNHLIPPHPSSPLSPKLSLSTPQQRSEKIDWGGNRLGSLRAPPSKRSPFFFPPPQAPTIPESKLDCWSGPSPSLHPPSRPYPLLHHHAASAWGWGRLSRGVSMVMGGMSASAGSGLGVGRCHAGFQRPCHRDYGAGGGGGGIGVGVLLE